uniref:Uncharacterized protein n=1 Tax=Timema bartmani TaxID=61472 RepID=A0A7R9F6B7_9NEOP|nr:unnamed protein product [Timema bartmani]
MRPFIQVLAVCRQLAYTNFSGALPSVYWLLFTSKALQGKWKNLKDAYRKHWKLQKSNKSGQARKQVKSYFYAAQLSFMKDVVELGRSMSSTPVPVPGSNRHLIEETLSHSQPSEGSPSRPISSSGRPLGLLPWNKLLFSSEEKKPRRTSLQVQLTKQPSSESLNFSPTSPGVASWMDNNSRMSDYPSPDKLQPGPEMTLDKLTRKESYKAQRKNYCREKKRVANELLSSLKDPSVVVMADWLKVRGTLKSWTKLWCILKPGLLLLYKSPKVKVTLVLLS